jgi:hypothetical protein
MTKELEELTDVDKAIQNRIKHFCEVQNLIILQYKIKMKIRITKAFDSNKPKHFESNFEIDAIIKCADYNFGLWRKMDPTKNYDITIYLLSVASYTLGDNACKK